MAEALKKKLMIEDIFGTGAPTPVKSNYVGDEYITRTKNEGGVATTNNRTKESSMDLTPIRVDGVTTPKPSVKQEIKKAMEPETPKPSGPYVPLDSQAQAPVGSTPGEYNPKKDDSFPWERALIGATPLLVGMLTGNSLEGAQVSGDYLTKTETDLYKRENDFDYKIEEMKAKRAMAGSDGKSTYNKTEVLNPETGKTEMWSTLNGGRHQFLGLKSPTAEKGMAPKYEVFKGEDGLSYKWEMTPGQEPKKLGLAEDRFAPKYDVQPTTLPNGDTRYQTTTDNRPTGFLPGNVPQKDVVNTAGIREQGTQSRFEKTKEQQAVDKVMNPNSIFNKSKAEAESLVRAADLLNKNNPVANQNVKVYVARLFQSGVLSDMDMMAMQGSGAMDAKFGRMVENWSTGDFREGDAEDLREIIQVLHPYIKQRGINEVENISKAHDSTYPGVRARLKSYTAEYGGGTSLPAFTRLPPGAKRTEKPISTNSASRPTVKPDHVMMVKGNDRFEVPLSDTRAVKDLQSNGFKGGN